MNRAQQNRKNALQSTGPKTAKGKSISAGNALQHGAYSQALVVLNEKPDEFEALRHGMLASLQPEGFLENSLVEQMISLWWRMQRAKLTANQSLWCSAKLDLQERLTPGIDFDISFSDMLPVPPDVGLAEDIEACPQRGAWNRDREKQERLWRHEQALERAFFRLLHELERLQERRRGAAVPVPAVIDVNVSALDEPLASFRQTSQPNH